MRFVRETAVLYGLSSFSLPSPEKHNALNPRGAGAEPLSGTGSSSGGGVGKG